MMRAPGSRVVALASLAISLLAAAAARGQTPLEAAVKAAYLYKFAPFVDWPAGAFAGAADPLVICVVGEDPFGSALDRVVAGQRVAGRPIAVRRLPRAGPASGCQIMYIGGSNAQPVKAALRAMHASPVLTVTDDPSAPGVICFATEGGRVRFRVDDQEAAADGLTISSKLLTLALSVKPRAPGARP